MCQAGQARMPFCARIIVGIHGESYVIFTVAGCWWLRRSLFWVCTSWAMALVPVWLAVCFFCGLLPRSDSDNFPTGQG